MLVHNVGDLAGPCARRNGRIGEARWRVRRATASTPLARCVGEGFFQGSPNHPFSSIMAAMKDRGASETALQQAVRDAEDQFAYGFGFGGML